MTLDLDAFQILTEWSSIIFLHRKKEKGKKQKTKTRTKTNGIRKPKVVCKCFPAYIFEIFVCNVLMD